MGDHIKLYSCWNVLLFQCTSRRPPLHFTVFGPTRARSDLNYTNLGSLAPGTTRDPDCSVLGIFLNSMEENFMISSANHNTSKNNLNGQTMGFFYCFLVSFYSLVFQEIRSIQTLKWSCTTAYLGFIVIFTLIKREPVNVPPCLRLILLITRKTICFHSAWPFLWARSKWKIVSSCESLRYKRADVNNRRILTTILWGLAIKLRTKAQIRSNLQICWKTYAFLEN